MTNKKKPKRISHDKVDEKAIIMLFLTDKKVYGEPYYAQNHEYPDCTITSEGLCIEETSVQRYDVTETLDKSAIRKTFKIKYRDKSTFISKIREAINRKQNHRPYSELPNKYSRRILLVRISGLGLDWRLDPEYIFNAANFLDLESGIFNEIYLVIYPLIPTKEEIDNKIFERPLRSDFVRIV